MDLEKRESDKYLDIAENLLYSLKDITKRQDKADERLNKLEQTSEINTTQRYIIKDLTKQIVNRDLIMKTRSHKQVAYSTVYRDMRMYGLASPLAFTQKKDYENIVEALHAYKLDVDRVNRRVEEIKKENEQ